MKIILILLESKHLRDEEDRRNSHINDSEF